MSDILSPEMSLLIGKSITFDRLGLTEEEILEIERTERHLKGLGIKDGIKVARNVVHKINNEIPLSHPPIIEGVRSRRGDNIVASPTPFNRGLMRGFGIRNVEFEEVRGGNIVLLGTTGLSAALEPIFDGYDYTPDEISAMKGKNSTIAVVPVPALRAVISINPIDQA